MHVPRVRNQLSGKADLAISAVTSVRKPSVTIIFSNKMDFSVCADKTSLLRPTYTIVITLIDQVANIGAAGK